MDPSLLRTFLTVKARLSFTRAAEDLLLSQPAVSRQVQKLEEELGVALFEKLGKSLYLTEAGRALGAVAERLLGDLERAAETVRAHAGKERGVLRVGASTTPGFYLLPRVLGRFHRRHPQVELGYTVENSLRIEQAILRNEIDMGFVGAHLAHQEIHLEPIVEDEIAIFTGAAHPLARLKQVPLPLLEQETWVVREKGSATRRLVEEELARSGLKLEGAVTLGCPEAVKAVVAGGWGLSFLSVHGLRPPWANLRLKTLKVSGFPLRRPIYWARHSKKVMTPLMEAFLQMVKAAFPVVRKR